MTYMRKNSPKHLKILAALPEPRCIPYTNMKQRYARWIERGMKAYKVLEEIEAHLLEDEAFQPCPFCGAWKREGTIWSKV